MALHAAYVAFVFGVLFFGALAFRQILDDLAVKGLAMGEDRDSFLDAAWVVVMAAGWIGVGILGLICYGLLPPSIYAYAVPMVIGVQVLQLTLRLVFQRTQVKTRGLVVRSVLFDRVRAVDYTEIVVVRFVPGRFWTEVWIGLPAEEVGFRIFSFSGEAVERLLRSATTAPVLWSAPSVSEHP